MLVAGWVASLLVDPRTRLRQSGFEGPIALFTLVVLASVIVNNARVDAAEAEVVKGLTFFASFLLVFYLVVSTVRTRETVDLLAKVLVAGGAVVAVLALVESRSGFNAFDHLARVFPLLELEERRTLVRGARLRVFGSAQHPIALGAALAMLLPLAIYLARKPGRRHWWLPAGLLVLGALATVSRTAIVMLIVAGGVFLWLRPRETMRLWPLLLPTLIVVHLALPGTIGTLKKSFFPEGGLIQQQRQGAGGRGSGRIADLRPALAEYSERPILGQGYKTRIVERGRENADILDNQWLATLLETGAVGAFAWIWLFVRTLKRFARRARDDLTGDDGWLLVALTAAIAAFAVGMFTFDSFSFIQVTFLFYILLALGATVLIGTDDAETLARERAPRPSPQPAPVSIARIVKR
jgi:hypothetical protein